MTAVVDFFSAQRRAGATAGIERGYTRYAEGSVLISFARRRSCEEEPRAGFPRVYEAMTASTPPRATHP
jgi:hypothetical protein